MAYLDVSRFKTMYMNQALNVGVSWETLAVFGVEPEFTPSARMGFGGLLSA